jgi:L-2-hydroxycarboxylate dehydrogenase (NAD+)
VVVHRRPPSPRPRRPMVLAEDRLLPWLLQGRPTTDGMEAFHGVTLPFGGYKGAAVSMMMELFSGVLTGAAFGGRVSSLYNDFTTRQDVGHFIMAIRPDLFLPLPVFKARMDEYVRLVKAQPRAAGCEEILMPGEPEAKMELRRASEGVPLQMDVLRQLREDARIVGVPFPFEEEVRE